MHRKRLLFCVAWNQNKEEINICAFATECGVSSTTLRTNGECLTDDDAADTILQCPTVENIQQLPKMIFMFNTKEKMRKCKNFGLEPKRRSQKNYRQVGLL